MSKSFFLGMFVLATLTILATGVFLIGRNQLRFTSTYRVQADFASVSGLAAGGDVRVGGLHKGTVRRIDLPRTSDGKVTVLMDLERATHDLVKKDSVAAIKSEGLIGDKYVDISFGSANAPPLQNGDSIAGEPPIEMAGLIKKANEILDNTTDATENFQATTESLKSITSKIDQGKGTAGALINDKAVYQKAAEGAAAFADNMQALKHNFFLRGFFKQRGYEDSSELAKNEIPKLPASPPLKTFHYDGKQIFDKPETAKLKKQEALNEAGKFLETNRYGLAVVASSAGMRGDSSEQRLLTEARAMVVRDYLTQNFRLDDTRLKTMGLGKTQGDAPALEILIYPVGVNPPAAPNNQAAGTAKQ
jgi:phospholipid/cholesterol/gamma-HCH transport system substrate-binding protein